MSARTPKAEPKADATHLTYQEKTNLGSYYTPLPIVRRLYDMLQRNAGPDAADIILENACGYGAFFAEPTRQNHARLIGSDMDAAALDIARRNHPDVTFLETNALANITRAKYGIRENERLIIVGNPPYNDVTSHAKNRIKTKSTPCEIDPAVRTRDLGLSFLLSYEKLSPDYIAILHPLSYLIKETNFNHLRPLMRRYALRDALVFNSQEFTKTSKVSGFPIVIALYARDAHGTTYADITRRRFRTIEGATFSHSDYDYITRYISKYPARPAPATPTTTPTTTSLAAPPRDRYRFFTMRDINALKRSRTFICEDTPNTIHIPPEKLPYYCYVDAFKDIAPALPYYLGNFDVMFDPAAFEKLQPDLLLLSAAKHPTIFPAPPAAAARQLHAARTRIHAHFTNLLAPHCHVYPNED